MEVNDVVTVWGKMKSHGVSGGSENTELCGPEFVSESERIGALGNLDSPREHRGTTLRKHQTTGRHGVLRVSEKREA